MGPGTARRAGRPRRAAVLASAVVVGSLAVGGAALAGPAGAATAAAKPEPRERPAGPWPPRAVLDADPSQVPPPRPGAAAAAAPCPAADPGVHSRAPGRGKTVALTFDDGPGASTQAIMGILEDAGVAATFFNIGINMTTRPEHVRAQAAQGFLLANHTWSHPDLTTLTAAQQGSQLDRASDQLAELVGQAPCLMRPPYGAYNSTVLNVAQSRDLEVWNWSVDTEDWRATSGSADQVARIVRLGQAGGSQTHPVVLMHNQPRAMPATVAALPTLITFYRDRGYTFVDLNGRVADRYVSGDWDGNGTTTPGVVRGNTWYLRNSNSAGAADVVLRFGSVGDRVVTGDWNGDGTTTPGVVRGNTWYRRANNDPADSTAPSLAFGRSSDRVVTGDWNGDGTTTIGVVRGNTWHLRRSNAAGNPAVSTLTFGRASDRVVTGDWNGDGTTTPGVVRGSTWFLRRNNTASDSTSQQLPYGRGTDRIATGDWDGNGTTTQGVLRGPTWFQRAANTESAATRSFTYSP
jgi:peptidoglycan/xylan/chitin deacetylase (PgdA/CDA1 family)